MARATTALPALMLACCLVPTVATANATRYERAVEQLDGDHDAAVGAVRALRGGGARAANALEEAWVGLTPIAKRRALPVLETLALRHDAAVACLVEAARSSDATLRNGALRALGASGTPGLRGLEELLPHPVAGPAAALALAQADPDRAIPILLRRLGSEGAGAPPEVREALSRSTRRADHDVEPSFERWLASEPPSPALAQAALALASPPDERDLQTRLIESAIVDANDFPTDWRLVTASATAGPSNRIDAWLIDESRNPEAWMLRAAAIDALAARDETSSLPDALDDPYPRVRIHAARALANDADTMTERATMARRDRWPMVRAAAIQSLRDEPAALPVVVAAVDDPMSDVRTAAIQVLVRVPDDTGWDEVHGRLKNQNEWPSVVAAGIDYVRAHCRRDAVEALYYVVKRAASPSALTDDVANAALAVETLRVLGTPDAEAIVAQLRAAETLPQPLETALKRDLSGASPCPPAAP